jgi:hypothetical protein
MDNAHAKIVDQGRLSSSQTVVTPQIGSQRVSSSEDTFAQKLAANAGIPGQ